jgi:hypothetical protein
MTNNITVPKMHLKYSLLKMILMVSRYRLKPFKKMEAGKEAENSS